MGNATEAWDDSGTIPGVASDPTSAESPLFVLDETVDNVGIAMQPLAAGDALRFGGTSPNVRTPGPARPKIAPVGNNARNSHPKLGHPVGTPTSPPPSGEAPHAPKP